jgi:hypothetical protein
MTISIWIVTETPPEMLKHIYPKFPKRQMEINEITEIFSNQFYFGCH